jgi:uncharacterized membrane protein
MNQTGSLPKRGFRAAVALHPLLSERGFYAAALCSALCLGTLVVRWQWTGRPAYLFLVWNLFLAWLPWLFSLPMAKLPSRVRHGWKLVPLFGAWLFFLPNAPYLVTDLLHLRPSVGIPLWFDAAMFFAFAWTGCLLGFFSLTAVHGRIEGWMGRAAGWLFVLATALLTGFGIYLGRFLRWNSWDVVTNPTELARSVLERALQPDHHPRTFGVTLLFAALFLAGYMAFASARTAPARQAR